MAGLPGVVTNESMPEDASTGVGAPEVQMLLTSPSTPEPAWHRFNRLPMSPIPGTLHTPLGAVVASSVVCCPGACLAAGAAVPAGAAVLAAEPTAMPRSMSRRLQVGPENSSWAESSRRGLVW